MTLTMNQSNVPNINETEAAKLLDFNQKFDIPLLDRVVDSLYKGQGQQVKSFNFFLIVFYHKLVLNLLHAKSLFPLDKMKITGQGDIL